ncbi:MAG: 4Fe-4S binding protein [Candidatus Helarchaeota archaeon]|nr:4Fe-4S binding protein [Candidatus Helarchaeota archaeon]
MPKKKHDHGTSKIGVTRRYGKYIKLGMRLSKIPLIGGIFERFFDIKNSNGSLIPINKSLGTPENVILPLAITEHFINKASHIFLMNSCGCRKGKDCKDYDHSIGCTWLGEAVLKIDVPPEVGHFATKEEALERERLAYEKGLVPSIGRLRADSWLMGTLPDTGHFMSLCHCCPCCCVLGMLKYGRASLGRLIQRMEGITVEVNRDICVGCGQCAEVCIFDAMKISNGKAKIDQDKCKGCGRCERKCPNEAITITLGDPSCIDETIARISAHVDVS